MKNLKNILLFGWPYLRRYWGRLLAGVLLGVFFGLTNASFIWATKFTFTRLSPEPPPAPISTNAVAAPKKPLSNSALTETAKSVQGTVESSLDPWMPKAGRPIDARQIIGGLLLLPFLVALRGFVGYFSSYCLGWVSERVINDLRLDVLLKLNGLSLDFFNRSTVGDLLTRINGDTAALHRCLSLGFSDLIKEPITIVGVVTYLCFIDWKLTLFAVVFLPLCVLPVRILGKKIGKASQGTVSASVSQASLLIELINNIRVVKAFNLEDEQVKRFRRLSSDLVHHGMKTVQARELVNPIIETVSTIGLGVLIVFIFASGRSIPDVIGFLVGVVTMYTPIKKLGGIHVLFQQTSAGVDRLISVLREQPSVREPANSNPFPPFQKELAFENISFAYASQPVLQTLSLKVPRGFRLGLAGESGSGKSTLVNLLFRFYDPSHGRITLDGADIRTTSFSDLRRQMALVSQEVVIFDLTIAQNIALGKIGATQAEIESAARAANAHEFIMNLPGKYETRVGERGVTLSGGQRQRVAIARAFVRNAPILVLDEATASLDSESESEVQAAIDRLAQDRTVICVAHRLSTLMAMDEIIVLSQGRIIEKGSFQELIKSGGTFAAMARKQGIQ